MTRVLGNGSLVAASAPSEQPAECHDKTWQTRTDDRAWDSGDADIIKAKIVVARVGIIQKGNPRCWPTGDKIVGELLPIDSAKIRVSIGERKRAGQVDHQVGR